MSAADHALSPLAARAAAHAVQPLAPGQALTLRPARAGVLHVQRGAVWATRRGPHAANAGAAGGDDVLRAGQRLRLHAGEVLVLEPIAVPGTPAQRVALHWQPAADTRWATEVARPASELQRALRDAVRAGGQLLRGTAAWAGHRLGPCRDARCLHDA